jgi:hypothetical protein
MQLRALLGRSVPLALALAVLPLVAGCELLYGPNYYGSVNPAPTANGAGSSPLPVFRTGTASLTFAGQAPITLNLRPTGEPGGDISEAIWTDGHGWYARLVGEFSGEATGANAPWWLELDRIAEGTHLTADGSRCTIKMTQADAQGLAGTATCSGLSWQDAMDMSASASPSPGASSLPTDASLSFSARP